MPDEMPAHRPLQMARSQMEKEIVDALKQCIDAHGPITRQNLIGEQAGPAGRQR